MGCKSSVHAHICFTLMRLHTSSCDSQVTAERQVLLHTPHVEHQLISVTPPLISFHAGCSGLHFTAAVGNAECTRMLCDAGADIDLGDKQGTPCHFLTLSATSPPAGQPQPMTTACCQSHDVACFLLALSGCMQFTCQASLCIVHTAYITECALLGLPEVLHAAEAT